MLPVRCVIQKSTESHTDWLATEATTVKVGWKYSTTESGVQSATMVSTIRTPKLHAGVSVSSTFNIDVH